MNTQDNTAGQEHTSPRSAGRNILLLIGVVVVAAVATLAVTFTLIQMIEHKQEARSPYLRVVALDETSTDPAPWGLNWPLQFEQYKQTAGNGIDDGSSAMTASKLEEFPWLKRLYAGYAFSLDYREARGHAYMLSDQLATERITKRPQAGACLHCHASNTVLYRKVGLEAMGLPADKEALAASFNMPAVVRGFEELSQQPYHDVLTLLTQVPDGTAESTPAAQVRRKELPENHLAVGDASCIDCHEPEETVVAEAPETLALSNAHPVSCIDCHDPETMSIRITRPGFMQGMADLAQSDAPVSHMPSIEKWRKGDRAEPYDPNALATRQEMRSFVCGQCHVEYYCANKTTLTFPWGNGLKADDIEKYWEEMKFPDGTAFYDYKHGETGALVFKAQHPEFELWSQGIHARSGVSCVDCHMPYERVGAKKLSNHNVRSPMENINNACQTCHNVPEQELRDRVELIQGRTMALMERAAEAMTEMLDAILEAKAAGATEEQLAPVYDLQRKAMWRIDYISSENSKGFHADQEAARILAESIDYSRRAQAMALRLRAPEAPDTSDLPREPVKGITPDR